jgi:hypothetical protein
MEVVADTIQIINPITNLETSRKTINIKMGTTNNTGLNLGTEEATIITKTMATKVTAIRGTIINKATTAKDSITTNKITLIKKGSSQIMMNTSHLIKLSLCQIPFKKSNNNKIKMKLTRELILVMALTTTQGKPIR